MKTITENGKVVVINETKEEAIQTFVDMMNDIGEIVTPAMIRDFEIQGGETNAQLQEWVNDYASDLQTEKSEAAAFKRNPQSVDPINY